MKDGREEIRAHLARIDAACDRIVAWVFERGTLARFPRVVEYLTKENGGPGWQDSYQNHLISRLCDSRWFERDRGSKDLYRCTVDGSVWFREVVEWRMMAYRERLFPRSPGSSAEGLPRLGAPLEEHPVFFSEDFARTVGCDPAGARRIGLGTFTKYLTELEDGTCEILPEPDPSDS